MTAYASMYGPYRQVVGVGPHTATGTTITLECGHQTTIVPHMDAQGMAGDSTPCIACKEAENAMTTDRPDEPEPYAVNSGLEHDTPGTGLVPLPEDADERIQVFEGFDEQGHPVVWDSAQAATDAFHRCESGWTGDRCTFRLGHEGPHSN